MVDVKTAELYYFLKFDQCWHALIRCTCLARINILEFVIKNLDQYITEKLIAI